MLIGDGMLGFARTNLLMLQPNYFLVFECLADSGLICFWYFFLVLQVMLVFWNSFHLCFWNQTASMWCLGFWCCRSCWGGTWAYKLVGAWTFAVSRMFMSVADRGQLEIKPFVVCVYWTSTRKLLYFLNYCLILEAEMKDECDCCYISFEFWM